MTTLIIPDGKDEWGTPRHIFDELDREFHFTLDPCANRDRPLPGIVRHYNIKDDGLSISWLAERVFCNPPYSKNNIFKWIKKANLEKDRAESIVMLIPCTKTGTIYFRDFVLTPKIEIRYITGRINFVPLAGQNDNSNPLYSMLLIWRKSKQGGE
jgi:site-specific DNA-methyltransferase (adenine-specific)